MPDSTDKAGRPFNDHSLMTEGIFSPSFAGPDGTKVTNFPFRRIFMIGRKFG